MADNEDKNDEGNEEGSLVVVNLSEALGRDKNSSGKKKESCKAADGPGDDGSKKPAGRRHTKSNGARRFIRKALCIAAIAGTFYIGMNYSRITDYVSDTYNSAAASVKRETGDLGKRLLQFSGGEGQGNASESSGAAAGPWLEKAVTLQDAEQYVLDSPDEKKAEIASRIYNSLGEPARYKLLEEMIAALPAGIQKDMLIANGISQLSPGTMDKMSLNIIQQMLAYVEGNVSSACGQTSIPYCETIVRNYVLTGQNRQKMIEAGRAKIVQVMKNVSQYMR